VLISSSSQQLPIMICHLGPLRRNPPAGFFLSCLMVEFFFVMVYVVSTVVTLIIIIELLRVYNIRSR